MLRPSRPLRAELRVDHARARVHLAPFALSDGATAQVDLLLPGDDKGHVRLDGSLDSLRGTTLRLDRCRIELTTARVLRALEDRLLATRSDLVELHLAPGVAGLECLAVVAIERDGMLGFDVDAIPVQLRTDAAGRFEVRIPRAAPAAWRETLATALAAWRVDEADDEGEADDDGALRLAPIDVERMIAERVRDAGWTVALPRLGLAGVERSADGFVLSLEADDSEAVATYGQGIASDAGHLLKAALHPGAPASEREAALIWAPSSAALWTELAHAARREGRIDAALHGYKRVATLARVPGLQAEALLAQAELRFAEDPRDPAVRTLLERARQRRASTPGLFVRLAALLERCEEFVAAARAWTRAADACAAAGSVDPDPAACHLRAATLWHDVIHDADNALVALRRTLALRPWDADATRRLHDLLVARGERGRAQRHVRSALEAADLAAADEMHARRGFDAADEGGRGTTDEPPGPAALDAVRAAAALRELLADSVSAHGDEVEAARLRDAARSLLARDVAGVPVDRRRTDRRRNEAAASPNPPPPSPHEATPSVPGAATSPTARERDALAALTPLRQRAQRSDASREARQTFVAALLSTAASAPSQAWELRAEAAAMVYYELDEPGEAGPVLAQLWDADEPRFVARPELAGALYEIIESAGAFHDALRLLRARAAHAASPAEAAEWRMLGARVAAQAGDEGEALALLDAVPGTERDAGGWARLRATVLAPTRPDEALATLDAAWQTLEPGAADQLDLATLALAIVRDGDPAAARPWVERRAELRPPDAAAFEWLACMAQEEGRVEDARRAWLRALGIRVGALGPLQDADDAMRARRGLDPEDLAWDAMGTNAALAGLACVAWRQGDATDARRWTEMVLAASAAPPDTLPQLLDAAEASGDGWARERVGQALLAAMLPSPARDALEARLKGAALGAKPKTDSAAAADASDDPVWDEGHPPATRDRLGTLDELGRSAPEDALAALDQALARARKPSVRRALLVRRARWLRVLGDQDGADLSLKGALILDAGAPDTRWEFARRLAADAPSAERERVVRELVEALAERGRPADVTWSAIAARVADLAGVAAARRICESQGSGAARLRALLDEWPKSDPR